MNRKGHYQSFDVLAEQAHWDDHTRQIVTGRLKPADNSHLLQGESTTLRALCSVLLDEARPNILDFVLSHLDSKMGAGGIGEGQRKVNVPKQDVLIRGGMAGLSDWCQATQGAPFASLEPEVQKQVVGELLQSQLDFETPYGLIPAKEFVKKVLTEAVSAYYSHPDVWSEIGYAGPAYPRGYVRTERGLTDPWEAKHDA